MLDFNHILANPNIDVQTFVGTAQTTAGAATGEWKTWVKPRGARFVYMIGVGGGSSGGCGTNSGTNSGGGAGGGSGAQSTLMIPAMFLPDVLYIQAGLGGSQPATLVSAATGVAGTITYVAIEPWNTLAAQLTVLFANAGAVTGAATTTTGGTAGTAAAVATIANMPLAGRGVYQFFAGQAGTAGGSGGGSPGAGVALTYPTTGLMVQGGQGGVGYSNVTSASNNGITGAGFGDNFPSVAGALTSDPTGNGSGGTMIKPFQYTGGTGGIANRAGGNGGPGCGGGGAGGSSTATPTLARPGDGGPGFVYIYSW
jgi:hypothetical protein